MCERSDEKLSRYIRAGTTRNRLRVIVELEDTDADQRKSITLRTEQKHVP